MPDIEGWFDGAYRDGKIGVGVILKNKRTIIFSFSGEYSGASNNDAEYAALLKLLEFIKNEKITEPILIRGDSRLVVEQMKGHWKMRAGVYIDKALKAQTLMSELKNVKIKWTSRDNNKEADKLSKLNKIK